MTRTAVTDADFYLIEQTLDDESRQLLRRVREFMEKSVQPVINHYWTREEFPFDLMDGFRRLGVAGQLYQGYGCPGGGYLLDGMIAMELARVDPSIATFFGVHGGLAMGSIYLCGSEEQKQRWLPEMARMDKIGAFGHGFTYGGHPVAAAVALKAIEIYGRDRIVENTAKRAPLFQGRLRLLGQHPLVGEARGLGLIGGVELVADKSTKRSFNPRHGVGARAVRFAEEEGLLVRAVGGDTLTLSPPLVIKAPQIEELFEKLRRALDKTLDWVTSEKLAEP